MRRFLCALAFLTRVPVRLQFDARDVGRATVCFPMIGALLGLLAVGVRVVCGDALPPFVVAFLTLGALALATGALHLDGLADMADGFGGGRRREDVLRIMRDHVIGAYGACALVFVIGLKAACLAALADDGVIVLAAILGRWASVPVGMFVPYARREAGGLGAAITDFVGFGEVLGATLFAAGAAFWLCGADGAIMFGAVIAMTAAQAWWCVRKIGGVTGDTMGANTEACEALVYVVGLACAG